MTMIPNKHAFIEIDVSSYETLRGIMEGVWNETKCIWFWSPNQLVGLIFHSIGQICDSVSKTRLSSFAR